jgi:DNA-binding NarL/FixJ family response regulator
LGDGSSYVGGRVVKARQLAAVMSSLRSLPARERLTSRELEILQLISEGLTNKQIANRLSLSAETVKSHVSAVHAKLDADSRAHAVAIAFRHGLLT